MIICRAILRLKRLWASLSDRRLRVFEQLEEVMSAQQNFKNYYHEINEKQLPVLPYIGNVVFRTITKLDSIVLKRVYIYVPRKQRLWGGR